MLRVGPLTIDVRARAVSIDEKRVELSAKEYELLLALAGDPGRVFTRRGAAARRVGVSQPWTHPDARQPRVSAAAEAR